MNLLIYHVPIYSRITLRLNYKLKFFSLALQSAASKIILLTITLTTRNINYQDVHLFSCRVDTFYKRS